MTAFPVAWLKTVTAKRTGQIHRHEFAMKSGRGAWQVRVAAELSVENLQRGADARPGTVCFGVFAAQELSDSRRQIPGLLATVNGLSVEESAALQGIEVGQLLRTIVIRRGADDYVFVLVPGGLQIDWPKLRTHLGQKRLSLPDQDEAREATGYERGAITPVGSKRQWPAIADASVAKLDKVAIGGGGRGVNLHLMAKDLLEHLGADVADVTKPG